MVIKYFLLKKKCDVVHINFQHERFLKLGNEVLFAKDDVDIRINPEMHATGCITPLLLKNHRKLQTIFSSRCTIYVSNIIEMPSLLLTNLFSDTLYS